MPPLIPVGACMQAAPSSTESSMAAVDKTTEQLLNDVLHMATTISPASALHHNTQGMAGRGELIVCWCQFVMGAVCWNLCHYQCQGHVLATFQHAALCSTVVYCCSIAIAAATKLDRVLGQMSRDYNSYVLFVASAVWLRSFISSDA